MCLLAVCISHKVDDVSNVVNQLEAVDDIRAQALQVCINVTIYGHCYYIYHLTGRPMIPFTVFHVK